MLLPFKWIMKLPLRFFIYLRLSMDSRLPLELCSECASARGGGAQCCSAEESAVSCFCKGLFLLVVVVKTNMWENNGIFFFCFPLHFFNTIKKPIKIK